MLRVAAEKASSLSGLVSFRWHFSSSSRVSVTVSLAALLAAAFPDTETDGERKKGQAAQ
jgi:hypothetical protein